MPKKILILDTYYRSIIERFHSSKVTFETGSSISDINSIGFGTGGAYAQALRKLGLNVSHMVVNSPIHEEEQLTRYFGKIKGLFWKYWLPIVRIPILGDIAMQNSLLYQNVKERIREFSPDIILVQDLNLFTSNVIRSLVSVKVLLIGEIASPLPPKRFYEHFDHIFSAHPTIVSQIAKCGISSSYLPLAFDSKFAEMGSKPMHQRKIPVTFIGSFGRLQMNTGPLLKEISATNPALRIYGNASQRQLRKYSLQNNYYGPIWGQEMYEILGNSKIVINRHGEIAGRFAVNMRMFEATGAGCLLITEAKENLSDLFQPESEVVTYNANHQAAELIKHYLSKPHEMEAISRCGRKRTLNEHTYELRVQEFLEVVKDLEIPK